MRGIHVCSLYLDYNIDLLTPLLFILNAKWLKYDKKMHTLFLDYFYIILFFFCLFLLL